MKNLPVTLLLLLACAGAHGATPVAPAPDTLSMVAAGLAMALLSMRHRPRTQKFS